jgi:pimeloyl-ACP methyl ester carboxylesterase
MAVFLIAHGAWQAGWAWKKMRALMAAHGREMFTPTYTGLGERVHLANHNVNLETHIQDILAVLEFEDLCDVILLGHSYGGMVATAVADRARGKIKHLVYLDAFAPEGGKSTNDYYLRPERREAYLRDVIDGWLVPAPPVPGDTSPSDAAWATVRRVPHPLQCVEQKFVLKNGPLTVARTYIYCLRHLPGDPFRQFLERAPKGRLGNLSNRRQPLASCHGARGADGDFEERGTRRMKTNLTAYELGFGNTGSV